MKYSKLAPTFRHRAVESAAYPRHFFFSQATLPNRITHLLYFSSTSTIQLGKSLLERELRFNLVMNGVSL